MAFSISRVIPSTKNWNADFGCSGSVSMKSFLLMLLMTRFWLLSCSWPPSSPDQILHSVTWSSAGPSSGIARETRGQLLSRNLK